MTLDTDFGIELTPVGIVRSPLKRLDEYNKLDQPAWIEVYPPYLEALQSIEANSHLWILQWFHKSNRRILKTIPRRFSANLPEFGVFGLRSPDRPNPIALTLVRLEAVEGNLLRLQGLDAIDGTPVLDIKSYYEQDIVFSPRTPYIRAQDPDMRRNHFLKQAISHHQEQCPDLFMAVRMVLVADEFMGHINRPDLIVSVDGSLCLGDTLQGLSRARLANPARFKFNESDTLPYSVWIDKQSTLKISARRTVDSSSFLNLSDQEIFQIEFGKSL